MSIARLAAIGALGIFIVGQVNGQNSPTTPQSVIGLMLSRLGGDRITDIVLTGTCEFIAGSTDETGTFTAKAASNGYHETQLNLSTFSRTETHLVRDGKIEGTWTDPQGKRNQIAEHNLIADHSWFFPGLALVRLLRSQSATFSFVGTESHNGESVEHFVLSNSARPDGTSNGPKFEHLEQVELYLDSASIRPRALKFNLHPDSNALVDLPVEIRYSEYKRMNGIWIPTHVQRYVNNTLTLEITITDAQINTGFSESGATN